MLIEDLLWARGEFLKLYAELPDLTLVASRKEIDDLVSQLHLPNGQEVRIRDAETYTLMGMHIENAPDGWHVRGPAGDTITRCR